MAVSKEVGKTKGSERPHRVKVTSTSTPFNPADHTVRSGHVEHPNEIRRKGRTPGIQQRVSA
jgi:hypothetical protein